MCIDDNPVLVHVCTRLLDTACSIIGPEVIRLLENVCANLSINCKMHYSSCSKSPTGVDWFILDTDPGCAPRIHRSVDYWARHIVEQATNVPMGGSVSTTLAVCTMCMCVCVCAGDHRKVRLTFYCKTL